LSPDAVFVAARQAQPITRYLELIDGNVEVVVGRLGLDESRLHGHGGRIPRAVLDQMWQCAADAVMDPHFGLHAAVACSSDLGGGNARAPSPSDPGAAPLGRYARMMLSQLRDLGELTDLQYRWGAPSRRLQLDMFEPTANVGKTRQRWEFAIATLHICLRALLGHRWEVVQVRFQHSEVGDLHEYRNVFGLEPLFDEPSYGLVLGRLGSRSCRGPEAHELGLEARHRVALELKRLLERSDRGRLPSLEEAARRMGIGARTLQRRLQAEGTTHRALSDEVRNSLAEQLLAAEGRNVADVACRLGFSEATAFRRAFKRWSGKVPSEARRAGR
jgi:AraC-like DNA-binding protein